MGDTILLRRGTLANLPDLQPGEPGWAEDANQLYIGTSAGTAESAMPIGSFDWSPELFTQASIETTLTAIGTNKATLLLRPGNWVISTALAFPANVTVKMPNGAYFSGAGQVTFANVPDGVQAGWWGFAYGTNDAAQATTNKAAILSAQASMPSGGGIVHLPKGTFKIDADIAPTVIGTTIQGAAPAFAQGQWTATTNLVFGNGTYGFDLVTNYTTAYYATIKDLLINGNSVLDNGIGIKGTMFVENVTVQLCQYVGVKMIGAINSTTLTRVGLFNNDIGLRTEGTDNTLMTLNNVISRQNRIGVQFLSGQIRSYDLYVESNTESGIDFYGSAALGVPTGLFVNTYSEYNGTVGGQYNVTFDSSGATSAEWPQEIEFHKLTQNINTADGIHLVKSAYVTFNNVSSGGTTTNAFVADGGATDTLFTVVRDSPNIGTISGTGTVYLETNVADGKTFSQGLTADHMASTNYVTIGKTDLRKGIATTGITTTPAKTIYTAAGATRLVMVFVTGIEAGGAKIFLDCVTYFPGQTPAVAFATTLAGTPDARTYTTSTTALQLVTAGGTYAISVSPHEIIQ